MNKKLSVLNGFLVGLAIIAGLRAPALAETGGKLSRVKVAVLYENITDGAGMGRSMADTIKLLKETRADMIFRGFWKWETVVDSPDNIPEGLLEFTRGEGLSDQQAAEKIKRSGHYYQALAGWISAIKKELPDIIFCGSIPTQHLFRVELDPIAGRVYTGEETWAMALDPQKWGITHNDKPITKEQFQARIAGMKPGKTSAEYDRRKAASYFPDITNPDFQDLMLSWAQKQIDCGADAIWIDMLYSQAKLLVWATGDPGHPAVKASLAAAVKLIDRIHKYGESKGKHIYVGSWGQSANEFGTQNSYGRLDFVTFAPTKEEIRNKGLDEEKWNGKVNDVRIIHGNIPIYSFIDWSNNDSQIVAFSQELSSGEQQRVLRNLDASFPKLGVNFVYPLHGGYMGSIATKLSFGKSRVYDSLAPEFRTYGTIKELAQKKAQKQRF
jgi:hypothetical protein